MDIAAQCFARFQRVAEKRNNVSGPIQSFHLWIAAMTTVKMSFSAAC
jgi:hypothetical protein